MKAEEILKALEPLRPIHYKVEIIKDLEKYVCVRQNLTDSVVWITAKDVTNVEEYPVTIKVHFKKLKSVEFYKNISSITINL